MQDHKYVTMKEADWENMLSLVRSAHGSKTARACLERVVEGAVVIRTQDVFAGPALHSYAANIGLVAKIMRKAGMTEQARSLQSTADYFHDAALAADATDGKLPD